MTPEELNRKIEFIVESQARLAAAQEQDRQDRVKFEEWSKGLLAQITRTNDRLSQTEDRLSQIDERVSHTDDRLSQTLTDQSRILEDLSRVSVDQTRLLDHQSQRMDRLDKFYDGWLRQNGEFQQQVLDLLRQALHLLNLILDRLPSAWPPPAPG